VYKWSPVYRTQEIKEQKKGTSGSHLHEATPILEGESTEKVVNHLKAISSKLEEKLLLQTIDERWHYLR